MSNQSFFAINYQLLSFCRDGGHAVPRLKAESLGLELDVGGLPFLINLERGIIFEGRPSIAAYTYPLYNISLPKAEEAWLYFSLTQGFCSPSIYPFQKWQNITYDPTIMSLLTDEGTPATEDTPLQAKKSKTALIVSLSVIIPVVVIVTVIAILANTVPKVKYFFRPYTKRRPTAASVELRSSTPNTTSATNGKGWHNAAKPT